MGLGAGIKTTQLNQSMHTVDENNDYTHVYFLRVLTSTKTHTDTETLNVRTKLQSLERQLHTSHTVLIKECKDLDSLNSAKKHLQAAVAMLQVKQPTKILPAKRKIAANSNQEKQLQFFSTKKKRLLTAKRISKPSHAEANEQRSNLSKVEPKFCGVPQRE
jgi:hypothetical protein